MNPLGPVRQVVGTVDRWQRRTPWAGAAYGVMKKFGDDNANLVVVAMAWYGFLSIFPLLLVVPAFALDLVSRRMRDRNDWLVAATMAAAFVVTFFATQWFFSEFLLTSAADNGIFMGNRMWSYGDRIGAWTHEYWDADVTTLTPAICLALAFVSARIGLSRGRWMREVVR